MGVGGQIHAPAALTSEERRDRPCTGGLVGPRVGLDGCGQSVPCRGSTPDGTARRESLTDWAIPAAFINSVLLL
jgi:hypothetical protein